MQTSIFQVLKIATIWWAEKKVEVPIVVPINYHGFGVGSPPNIEPDVFEGMP